MRNVPIIPYNRSPSRLPEPCAMPSSRLIQLVVFAFVSLRRQRRIRRGAHPEAARPSTRAPMCCIDYPERPRARRLQGRRAERAGQHHQAHDRLRRVPRLARKAAQPQRQRHHQRTRLEGGRLAHLRASGHADSRGHAHQGHDRAVGQRRHDRAGREVRRHRRRLRADDEFLRGRARPQELAFRKQLGRPGPDSLHERA